MKAISSLEVKRCFIIGDLMKPPARKPYSPASFKKKLSSIEKRVLAMSEKQLDARIGRHSRRRLRAYNTYYWVLKTFKTSEIGVWKRAGGLPLDWTRGPVSHTGQLVRKALKEDPTQLVKRARHTIPGILSSNIRALQKEKYLLPIIFKSGTGTNGRRGLRKLKGDIDDGCMRSVALVVSGAKKIKAYYGVPKR